MACSRGDVLLLAEFGVAVVLLVAGGLAFRWSLRDRLRNRRAFGLRVALGVHPLPSIGVVNDVLAGEATDPRGSGLPSAAQGSSFSIVSTRSGGLRRMAPCRVKDRPHQGSHLR